MKNYIKRLQQAIRDLHGCQSQYLETVTVKEMFQGKIVWWGDVEVFEIRGHPTAQRAYAWSQLAGTSDQGSKYVTVLELPPVTSPENAVRAVVSQQIKDKREKDKDG